MHLYEVIKRPIITEKTQYLAEANRQYTFEVDRRANKVQVKRAVETIYGVRVTAVNIMNMPAKAAKRWGRRRVVRRPVWKKAVVTLAEGDKIPVFEGG
ncbi:MAG TPA: 50S ribosomal protein L23 [Anaerolineales bacterium]|nr:50S ribosomal protein L23 [Anaerolineales bacterium]